MGLDGSADYGPDTPGVEGSVMTVNGGPQFLFTEAISFEIHCEDQAEINRIWDALTADGGEPGEQAAFVGTGVDGNV